MSLVPEATDERKLKALEGQRVSSKSPLRVHDQDKVAIPQGIKGNNIQTKKIIYFPSMQFNDFFYKTPAEKLS